MPSSITPVTKSILIIEDERFVGELYQRALERAGYTVTVINDGKQGLELAQTDRFDIILLDLMVPTITGSEILQSLRGTTSSIHSKIIIITNLEQRPAVRNQVERLADGYLVKAEITPNGLVTFLSHIQ